MGWCDVCDCCISWSYSLIVFDYMYTQMLKIATKETPITSNREGINPYVRNLKDTFILKLLFISNPSSAGLFSFLSLQFNRATVSMNELPSIFLSHNCQTLDAQPLMNLKNNCLRKRIEKLGNVMQKPMDFFDEVRKFSHFVRFAFPVSKV